MLFSSNIGRDTKRIVFNGSRANLRFHYASNCPRHELLVTAGDQETSLCPASPIFCGEDRHWRGPMAEDIIGLCPWPFKAQM